MSTGLNRVFIGAIAILMLASSAIVVAQDTYGAREGSILGGPGPGGHPEAPGDALIDEGFEDITNLPGWFMQNNSSPLGSTDWFQGNDAVFPAQGGTSTSYIAANFNNTSGGTGTISNWLLTSELDWSIAESLSFYTRTVTGNSFPDRMEVRVSTAGASTNVGTGANDVGDFTTLILEINPNLAVGGYPDTWTFFQEMLPNAGSGRIAFRYFVTGAGPFGNNSNYMGIDSVQVIEGLPVPSMGPAAMLVLLIVLAIGATLVLRRQFV